jgi:uncharacterized protein (TIGR04255 family)
MPNYNKPPIIEALFDIHVELPESITAETLKELSSKIADEYPEQKPRQKFSGHFEFAVNKPAKTEASSLGVDAYLNYSKDKKYVVQFRLDGFAFNRLAPYQGWRDLFDKAMLYWKLYAENLKPTLIRRIIVRNINEILIPKTIFDLSKYLVNPPKSPDIPAAKTQIANFFDQVQFTLIGNEQIKATITQTTSKRNLKPGITPLVLDIEMTMEIGRMIDDDNLELILNQFHGLKNELFESCITDETRELFKGNE